MADRVVVQLEDGTMQTFGLTAKTFSTGSRGFHAQGKVLNANGKKYQANFMLIEVGSKPKK